MSEERIKTKVQMRILKPAHQVFEVIVDPDKMNKYFITTSTGRMESGKTSNEYKDALRYWLLSSNYFIVCNKGGLITRPFF